MRPRMTAFQSKLMKSKLSSVTAGDTHCLSTPSTIKHTNTHTTVKRLIQTTRPVVWQCIPSQRFEPATVPYPHQVISLETNPNKRGQGHCFHAFFQFSFSCFLQLLQKRILGDKSTRLFTGQMAFLSSNQHCQSTEANSASDSFYDFGAI